MDAPLRVLLVEDSPADAELLQLRLERGGFAVTLHRVVTGEDLTWALRHGGPWDLVIADYQLPRFGGLEAIALVRESGLDLPIIVVSGVIGEEAAVAALKAGAHDFVRKDNMARLVPAIERELREARERRARRVAEEAVRLNNERLSLLAEISHAFAEAAPGYRRLLDVVGDRLARVLDAVCVIQFVPGPDGRADAPVAVGLTPEVDAELQQAQDRLGGRPPGPAAPAGVPVGWGALLAARGPGAVFIAPMRARGRTLGTVTMTRVPERPFSEADVRLAQDLADRAALAIDNAKLYAHLEERVAERTAELEAANGRLRELDRIKGNFVNSVSHELRTPLTTIMGYAEFLEDGVAGPLSDEQRGFVHQIQASTARLQRLVDDLLDFARIDAGTFTLRSEPRDVCALLRAVAGSLRPMVAEARLALSLACAEEPCVAEVDPQRLEQVLTNLLTNAIKFTPAGGTISASVRREGTHLRVEVRDTGVGIASEDLPRLFQRFSQLDHLKGGTGLGLSISRALVEAHGGQMGVTSTLGEGSCFWFTLPLQDGAAPESPQK
ncbi:MAG: ATP-binding protein [Candidatus Sericytochromatia bacterium]|nr:ATP-binding protein [Candidatus Sericytochromatia bacterium]